MARNSGPTMAALAGLFWIAGCATSGRPPAATDTGSAHAVRHGPADAIIHIAGIS